MPDTAYEISGHVPKRMDPVNRIRWWQEHHPDVTARARWFLNWHEYYALILFSVVGMMCMAAGFDIVLIFIGLELMAISTYVLVGFLRRDKRSNEASLKYVLLGAFSSGILAYGFSLIYGLTGTTNIYDIKLVLSSDPGLSRVIELSHLPGASGLQAQELLAQRYPAALHLDPSLLGHQTILVAAAFILVAAGLFFKVAAVPFHHCIIS